MHSCAGGRVASSKTSKPTSQDGLERDGVEKGKLRFWGRILGYDPQTGKKVVDTRRKILADDKADALKQREKLIDELLTKKLKRPIRRERLRFSHAMDEYLATITRHSTKTTWGSYGRKLNGVFGDRWLDKVPTADIHRYLNQLELAQPTVDGIRGVLVNMFSWAMEQGHIAGPNPAAGIRLRRKQVTLDQIETETPKKKQLTQLELPKYLEVHQLDFADTYLIVLCMIAIGGRYSEVSVLKRSDIEWETGVATIRRAHAKGRLGPPKGNKSRLVAFPSTVVELLREHVRLIDESGRYSESVAHGNWLFPKPNVWHGPKGLLPIWSYTTLYNHIKASMSTAGIHTDNAAHMARHTLNGLMRGQVTDAVLRKVVGHSSEAMNLRYGDAQVVEFAEVVDRRMLGAGAPAPDNSTAGE